MQLLCLGSREDKVGFPWKKINKRGSSHFVVHNYVLNFGLMSLYDISYVNKRLIFIFDVPICMMTVTLNIVYTQIHLPIMGRLCPNEPLDFETTLETFLDLLGMERTRATSDLK